MSFACHISNCRCLTHYAVTRDACGDLHLVCNICGVTAEETSKLIDAAGGNRAFAQLLGIESAPYWAQRVSNWRRRGLPPSVLVAHYAKLQALREVA